MRFHIFRRLTLFGWRWYFRGTARNGKPILQSEGYHNRDDAVDTVNLIRGQAATAPVSIDPDPKQGAPK